MNKTPEFDPVQDTEILIGKFLSKEILPEEGERLLDFLQKNPDWEQKIFDEKRISDLLGIQVDDEAANREIKSELLNELYRHYEKVSDFSRYSKNHRRFIFLSSFLIVFVFIFAVTTIVYAFLSVSEINPPRRVNLVSPFTVTTQAVARLSQTIDAEWDPDSEMAPLEGAVLLPGSYRLRKGMVLIQFYSGTTLIFEGPGQLELKSTTEVSCFQGCFSVEIPDFTERFIFDTPAFSVTAGKKYFVDITDKRIELHCMEGSVEYKTPENNRIDSGRLSKNKAVRFSGDDKPRIIKVDKKRPIFIDSFLVLSEKEAARTFDAWKASRKKLLDDTSLLLFLNFQLDPEQTKRNCISNRSSSHPRSPAEATLIGGRVGQGRWPGKDSLEFHVLSDRLLVSVPGELNNVTLSVSLRADEVERNLNSIFMTEGFGHGTLHWQILNNVNNGERGAIRMGIYEGRPGKRRADNFDSPVVFNEETIGVWLRLAVVLDADKRTITHYLNGKALIRHDVPFDMKFNLEKSEIGNWTPSTVINPIRNFVGGFEELLLFSRALTDEEIESLHLLPSR